MTWVLDSTRIKQTFLRPTSDYGTSVPHLATGFRRFCVTAVWGFFCLAVATDASAEFVRPPKTAVKTLKITRGRQFDSGVVFVDGKFIAPPYTVERYGTVIRINGIQVTQPVVDWSEFLKTQSGLVVIKDAAAPEAPEPVAPPVEETVVESPVEVSLEALLEDTPKTASVAPQKAKPAPKPEVKTTVRLEGEFTVNDRTRALVAKINRVRTDIDAALRRGGFFCFGSTYSTVRGDQKLAMGVLEKIPELMKSSSDEAAFAAAVRSAGFVYFPPSLVHDLFTNRLDYPSIQKRWRKFRDDSELSALIEKATSTPVF